MKYFLTMLGIIASTILFWAMIILFIFCLASCTRTYESGFYRFNKTIVYCKAVTKDDCGVNLFNCNDWISRYCFHNVELLGEIMAKEMLKPKFATKENKQGIIKYKKGKKK